MALRAFAFILILLFGFLAYSNTLESSFHYDDFIHIFFDSDVHVERFGFREVVALLAKPRPVAITTFGLNYLFGGFDPFGFHLVNIFIHILAAFGLFLLADITLRIFDDPDSPLLKKGNSGLSRPDKSNRIYIISLLAALLWLTNPLQIQAVTYIVQRMASMSAMFYLFSIYFFARGRLEEGRRRIFYLGLCLLAALLALGSKENAITLPFFIFLYEICIIRKGDASFMRKRTFYVPALLIAAVSGLIITVRLKNPDSILYHYFPYGGMYYVVKERFFTECRIFFHYMSLSFFPFPSRLNIEHDITLSRGFFNPPETALAVTGVFMLTAYALLSLKKKPLVSFLLLWIIVNLAPESLHTGIEVMYEHRTYLPFAALFLLLALATVSILGQRKRACLLLSFVVILSFTTNTYSRNEVWKDDISLWADSVKKSPLRFRARIGLGAALLQADKSQEAIKELEEAKKLIPRHSLVRYYLGVAYFRVEAFDKALDEFRFLWRRGIDPPESRVPIEEYYIEMARAFLAKGDEGKGRRLLSEVLSFSPGNEGARLLLKKIGKSGPTDEAIMPEFQDIEL